MSLRGMDGTAYTYVKPRNGRKRHQWELEISRHKALELREFLHSYFRKLVQVTDHGGNILVGYFRSNPFELMGSGRAGEGWPGGETMSIQLEFEQR